MDFRFWIWMEEQTVGPGMAPEGLDGSLREYGGVIAMRGKSRLIGGRSQADQILLLPPSVDQGVTANAIGFLFGVMNCSKIRLYGWLHNNMLKTTELYTSDGEICGHDLYLKKPVISETVR